MIKKVFKLAVRFYQAVFSPDKGIFKKTTPTCRFFPTCSDYALRAVEKFGILKGGILAAKRILKCHPFNEGGYDPVK